MALHHKISSHHKLYNILVRMHMKRRVEDSWSKASTGSLNGCRWNEIVRTRVRYIESFHTMWGNDYLGKPTPSPNRSNICECTGIKRGANKANTTHHTPRTSANQNNHHHHLYKSQRHTHTYTHTLKYAHMQTYKCI